jgi:hypothetical protein
MENNEIGWVCLWRQSINSKVFASQDGWKIWTWCLMKAHHSDMPRHVTIKTGRGDTTVTLRKGEFIFGRKIAAKELMIKEWVVYGWIKRLASDEYDKMITIQPKSHFSIIRVNNWRKYQEKYCTTK